MTTDNTTKYSLVPLAFVNLVISRDLFAQRLERAMRPIGLNMTSISLLSHFSRNPDRSCTISELVNVMGIHQPGITKATGSMLERGWLRRETNENDARIKHLFITDLGLATLRKAQELTFPLLLEGFADLDAEELQQLTATLDKIKNRLEATR